MKATIRTFQSGCGDCIFLILEDEKSGESFHIMIDCGVFTPKIKAFVEHDLGLRIDMLIVTHYDDDHIAGIIKIPYTHMIQIICSLRIWELRNW